MIERACRSPRLPPRCGYARGEPVPVDDWRAETPDLPIALGRVVAPGRSGNPGSCEVSAANVFKDSGVIDVAKGWTNKSVRPEGRKVFAEEPNVVRHEAIPPAGMRMVRRVTGHRRQRPHHLRRREARVR
jgi:hypothetical protein